MRRIFFVGGPYDGRCYEGGHGHIPTLIGYAAAEIFSEAAEFAPGRFAAAGDCVYRWTKDRLDDELSRPAPSG